MGFVDSKKNTEYYKTYPLKQARDFVIMFWKMDLCMWFGNFASFSSEKRKIWQKTQIILSVHATH